MEQLARTEESRWRDGFASGAVYHGDPDHVAFLNRIYAAQSQSNPLHTDLWPSAVKYESEIVSMTARMLGAAHAAPEHPVVGTVSSGGTESILLAMRTYRDHAVARRGIAIPEIVAPVTAHAAFDKAAQYFGMPRSGSPVGAGFAADLDAMAGAVTDGRRSSSARRRRSRTGSSTRSPRSPRWRRSGEWAATSTPAWAGSSCPGPSSSAIPCRRSTSACPA